MTGEKHTKQQPTAADARAQRLRAALRENLHRRKSQDRARKALDNEAEQAEQEKGGEWTE